MLTSKDTGKDNVAMILNSRWTLQEASESISIDDNQIPQQLPEFPPTNDK